MRKRMKKKIAGFLALVLVLQCFGTTSLFADEINPAAEAASASVSTETPAAKEEAPAKTEEENKSEAPSAENSESKNETQAETVSETAAYEAVETKEPAAEGTEASGNSASSDSVPADTPSENAVSQNTVSEDSASGNSISANAEEEENAGAVEKKAVTVMLYQVGCDLERNSLAARKDIAEIMQGIEGRANGTPTLAPSINFVVEIGGMDGTKNMDEYNALIDGAPDPTGNLTKLKNASFTDELGKVHNFQYTENQRWVISGDSITAAKTQPSDPGRPMNATTGNLNEELLKFINTTTEDYPAEQYVLILWDHGGGSNGGCGNDERNATGSIRSEHIRATMPETEVFGDGKKKLAWIGYDACLMANLETALTWKPYARFFSGSEELEGNDGWAYEGWVTKLCDEAEADSAKAFTDEKMDGIIRGTVGPTAVADFVKHYEDKSEGNATQSFVDLSKIDIAVTAFADYANEFLKLFADYPIDTYRAIRLIRSRTESFMGNNPPLADISEFTTEVNEGLIDVLGNMGLTDPEISKYYIPIKTQGGILKEKVRAAVVSENHTSEYGELGGLTVFFPYATIVSDEGKPDDIVNYRNSYDDEKTLDPYLDLLGLYCSVRSAGDILDKADTKQADVDNAFKGAMSRYEVSDRLGSGKIASVPAELTDHRIQNEAIKIRDDSGKKLVRRDFALFDSFNQHLVLKRESDDPDPEGEDEGEDYLYLGYLPGGDFTDPENNVIKQDLYNYDFKNWFGVVSANRPDKLPVALYSVDVEGNPNNALTGKVNIVVPVLGKDDGVYLLDISFENSQNQGKLNGMWPYSVEYSQFGRYIYNSGSDIKAKMPFRLLGNIIESTENRTGIEFDSEHPDDYVYGVITEDTLFPASPGAFGFYRNIAVEDGFSGGDYDSAFISNELRDIFDSAYFYSENPSYREELKVSLELSDKVSAIKKGTELKKDDIQVVLRNSAGEKVANKIKDSFTTAETLYYLKGEGDKKIPITIVGDYLAADLGSGTKPIKLDEDLDIYLDEKAISVNEVYDEIDLATETLSQSFSLQFAEGGDSVTVQVYNPESDQLSITALSNPLLYLDKANYTEGLSKSNYADYFKVTVGNIDVTTDSKFTDKLKFGSKTANASSWSWSNYGGALPKKLEPGTQIAVKIEYDKSLSANNTDNPIVVKKSPAKIVGTGSVEINRLQALKSEYSGPIEVKYYDAQNREITDVDSSFKYSKLSAITKDTSAVIDTKGIDNTISGSYIDLPLSVKSEWKSEFSKLFEIREFVLSSYVVHNVSSVRFLSSTDRKNLYGVVSVRTDSASKGGRISVSKGSIPIAGSTPVEWYYKAGTEYPVVVFRGDAPVKYGKLDLVEKNNKGEWLFYIPDNLNGQDVVFYAGYAAEAKNEGDIEVKIDPITPVEYTGRNIVTTKSTKSGSKVLGLVVRTSDGEVELVENVDYTVSYKNNKNVSDIYDRKPPTVIIKGKNAYKGLKYTINFSILPADLANATITVDRKYAPINSNKKKGVTLVTTVKLPGGAKVPTNRYEVHFYTKDDRGLRTEVTREQLASYYKTDKVYPLYVSAKAIQPADQGTNFVTGSRIDPANEAFVYAYPKTTGKISVTLKTKKYEYSEEGHKVEDIFKASNIKTLKAGGKTVSIGQIEPVEAYYDKKLTEPVLSDVLKDAGTYYLNVALTDTAKAQYRVFNSTPVQVTITGTKLKRSNIALMNTKIVAVSGNAREPESRPLVLRFASDFKWNNLIIRCTQRDGGTVDYWINKDQPDCYEENGMLYYNLVGVDNGAIGNYKVTVYGSDEYTGSVTYSYKVVAK